MRRLQTFASSPRNGEVRPKAVVEIMPTRRPRGSSPEAPRGKLRFNSLTGPWMAKIRLLVGRDEVIEWVTVLSPSGGSPIVRAAARRANRATALLAVADDVIE